MRHKCISVIRRFNDVWQNSDWTNGSDEFRRYLAIDGLCHRLTLLLDQSWSQNVQLNE